MKENQLIISFDINHNIDRQEVIIPNEVNLESVSIYKLFQNYSNHSTPILIQYGETIHIINNGHDYRLNNRTLSTSNPDIYNSKLLVEWGKEIKQNCDNCKHELSDIQKFCGECGTPTNF